MKALSDSDSDTVAPARRVPPAADAAPGRPLPAADRDRAPAAPPVARPQAVPGGDAADAPAAPGCRW
jgi:hypothetical protein